jgi:uncharacterized protein
MDTEKVQRSIVELVVECLDPDAIYLFGSSAQGRAGPDSDVDLLVVGPFWEPPRRRGLELRGLLASRVVPVDLHFRTPGELERERQVRYSLADTVLRHGRLVYQKPAG